MNRELIRKLILDDLIEQGHTEEELALYETSGVLDLDIDEDLAQIGDLDDGDDL